MIKEKTILIVLCTLFLFVQKEVFAGKFHVNPITGNNTNSGTYDLPVKNISNAIDLCKASTDTVNIICLHSGFYILNDVVNLDVNTDETSSNKLIIEALVMPDDSLWTPKKMPVIQSISGNNSFKQFKHSVGLQANRNHVTIRGIKFIGNPNPKVKYYYPIAKENDTLVDLNISQCYFIGERFSSPIQGAIYTHGEGLNVNHCIFYNCRNGILRFYNKANTGYKNSITHNIIWGAYEGAFWLDSDPDLIFRNNIISNCQHFLFKLDEDKEKYKFSDCVIANVDYYVSTITNKGMKERNVEITNIDEINVKKVGEVILIYNTDENLPRNYLHLTEESTGYEFNAGIFKEQ